MVIYYQQSPPRAPNPNFGECPGNLESLRDSPRTVVVQIKLDGVDVRHGAIPYNSGVVADLIL